MNFPEKEEKTQNHLVDRFSRTISYLRLSVTDRCNLRCLYCMPCESTNEDIAIPPYKNLAAGELLTYEELERIVRIAVSLGMSKLRLTGGEPLLRRDIIKFIETISNINGLDQIRLTTNGVLLKENAKKLYKIGVRHLNISLDTLVPEKFTMVTGKNLFSKVIDGIDASILEGFRIKLNVVAMKTINDDEFLDFAAFAIEKNIQVRFIEFMPIGKGTNWHKNQYIKSEKIHEIVSRNYQLTPIANNRVDGPARMYTIQDKAGKEGRIGFISPISHHFCSKCNRLRLTSEGKLRACLLHDGDTDLKSIIRKGCSDKDIEDAIRETILFKPENHGINKNEDANQPACHAQMSRIGG